MTSIAAFKVSTRERFRTALTGRSPIIEAVGIVKLTTTSVKGMKRSNRSHCLDRVAPLVGCLGSEDPERGARDEMALEVEGVVDSGVHAEKALCGARRLEPLNFALASTCLCSSAWPS